MSNVRAFLAGGVAHGTLILTAAGPVHAQPAATSQQQLPTPSATALALADAIALDQIPLLPNPTAHQIRSGLISDMLNRNQARRPCDARNEECRRIAEEIAEREGDRLAAEYRAAITRQVAIEIDRTMSQAERDAALAFMRRPEGAALARMLRGLSEPQRVLSTLQSLHEVVRPREGPWLDEFHRRTAGLPRGPEPPPPPAPPPATPMPPRATPVPPLATPAPPPPR